MHNKFTLNPGSQGHAAPVRRFLSSEGLKMRNLAVMICFLATIAMAQDAQQGSITGFVYDQSQAVVPNTVVTVMNQATGG